MTKRTAVILVLVICLLAAVPALAANVFKFADQTVTVYADETIQAALEQEGVSRLAGSALVDDIANLVGSRRMQARAITIGIAGDNRVTVDLKLNILVGFRLPDVVQQVQRSVIDNIEEVTGMTVTRVNVAVQDIDEQPVEEEDEEEGKQGDSDDPAAAHAAIPPMP